MTAAASARRTDPERRDRIIGACLEVIARDGVAGTSHRKVAAEADVPLGSMTYHFKGMDDLLTEAFTRFADQAAASTEELLGKAKTQEEAQLAIAALIDRGATEDPRNLEIAHELYTLAARNRAFRAITHRWLERSRRALERHFDPATARILDAVIEGLTLHQALDEDVGNQHLALEAVRRIVAAASPAASPRAAS